MSRSESYPHSPITSSSVSPLASSASSPTSSNGSLSPNVFCRNSDDPIFFTGLDHANDDVVLIFPNDSYQVDSAECYNREALQKLYNNSKVSIWKYEPNSKGIMVARSQEGKSNVQHVFRLPASGKWTANGAILDKRDKVYYLSPGQQHPIGSSFGVSQLHGTVETVYFLQVGDSEQAGLSDYYDRDIAEAKIKQHKRKLIEEKEAEEQAYYYSNYNDLMSKIKNIEKQVEGAMKGKQIDLLQNALIELNKVDPIQRKMLLSTALSVGVKYRSTDFINWLLQQGKFEWNFPLIATAQTANYTALQTICEFNQNSPDMWNSSLYYMSQGLQRNDNKFQEDIVGMLLQSKKNIKPYLEVFIKCGGNSNLVLNSTIKTYLHVQNNIDKIERESYFRLIQWLVKDNHAQPNFTIPGVKNDLVLKELLTEDNIQIPPPPNEKLCQTTDVNEIRFLIQEGADIHYNNDCALRHAISRGVLPTVRYLLDHGAILSSKKPVEEALKNGFDNVVQYLLENHIDTHMDNDVILWLASQYGQLSLVRYLTRKGADINTALILASRHGNLNVVQFLVEKGAANKVGMIHAVNDQAVIDAAKNGHWSVVRYLIQAGSTKHNDKIYELAVRAGNVGMTRFMVENAHVDIQKDTKALSYAIKLGYINIVKYLLSQGAKTHKMMSMLALEHGHKDIAEVINKSAPPELHLNQN